MRRWNWKRILWPLLPLVLVGLLLPGCFTSALWGTDLDKMSWTSERDYEHEDHVPVWVKVVCTPLAVFLDLLTAPIQDCLGDEDDDDDEDCGDRHHRRHHRR